MEDLRSIDKAIAEKVFGLRVLRMSGGLPDALPYSTDANACALLKKKLLEMGFKWVIDSPDPQVPDMNYYQAVIWLAASHEIFANADTEEIALCRAALKAMEAAK